MRFHRADLPFETSQAIYDRMKSERQREAKELRAQGFEWAQQIQARADRERTVILSEAQRGATINRGEGDAEASRRLAEAFGGIRNSISSIARFRPIANRSPIPARPCCCRRTRISCGCWSPDRKRVCPRPRRNDRLAIAATPALSVIASRRRRSVGLIAGAPPSLGSPGMNMGDSSNWWFVPLQILFIDLLLGADNALVIALACRSLAPEDMRRATTLGVAGAIVLRLAMTILATSLLAISAGQDRRRAGADGDCDQHFELATDSIRRRR